MEIAVTRSNAQLSTIINEPKSIPMEVESITPLVVVTT
jgi:hypothetical protein